jgi:hypothetical protein
MKKYIFIIGFLLMLVPSFAFADIYYWTDTEGVLHITDDMDNIPPEYREKLDTMETEGVVKGVKVKAAKDAKAAKPEKPKDPEQEIYGDHPLNWWRLTFNRLRGEIDSARKELEQKEQFIEMFRRGRRLGQRNNPTEIETLEKYSVEMPLIEKRLDGLEDRLKDLKRSARRGGVPKDIRK